MRRFTLIIIVVLLNPISQAAIIHVPGDQSTISAAVHVAEDGDLVVLADGVYSDDGNYDIYFRGKAIEVTSANGPSNCVIDGTGTEQSIFNFTDNEFQTSILSNITIKDCANAVYCDSSSPLLKGCIFSNSYLGAVISNRASPLISNCQFIENNCTLYSALYGFDLTVRGCIFRGNSSMRSGGAIFCQGSSTITNCIFSENIAVQGGAIHVDHPGSIIGGGSGFENEFLKNHAAIGADISVNHSISEQIDASYNVFHGAETDYFITPLNALDLTGCQFAHSTMHANDLYVSILGCDENDGLTAESPFKTVNAALCQLSSSAEQPTTIHVAAGTYSRSLTGEMFPIPVLPFVSIAGESSDVTIFDIENSPLGLFHGDSDFGVSLSGFTAKNSDGRCISMVNSTIVVKDCVIRDNNDTGLFFNETTAEVVHCDLENNTTDDNGAAISCISSYLTVNNCRITSNSSERSGAGIFCDMEATAFDIGANISNCIFEENISDQSGSAVYTNWNDLVVTNSEFRNNTTNVICCEGAGSIEVIGSQFTGNTCETTIVARASIIGCDIRKNTGNGLRLRSGSVVSCTVSENGKTGVITESADIKNCYISKNGSGGIYSSRNGRATIERCIIEGNAELFAGGGIRSYDATPYIINCLIFNNHAPLGGGIYLTESYSSPFTRPKIENCTIVNNTADQGGGLFSENLSPQIVNSILWNNSGEEIVSLNLDSGVTYSCIKGGYPGTGNIAMDPLFIDGESDDFRLSHLSAGQSDTSPCVDAGSTNALNVCFDEDQQQDCLDRLSTRTDGVNDTGLVDIGVHYPVASIKNPEVSISMPSIDFGPGDSCSCQVFVTHYLSSPLYGYPLFVLLDFYGEYYFAPSFSRYDWLELTYTAGSNQIEILPTFQWPTNAGSATGIVWYAALTDPEVSSLVSNLDSFSFGWHN